MTVLPIYVTPHPVLKTKAEPVEKITPEIRKLLDDMMETMYAARGIGLAAPQVGVSSRVIVMDVEQREDKEGEAGKPISLINPEIIWASDEIGSYKEGCLSIPDQYADVERPVKVRIKYMDENGASQELEADGLLAICIQHEIDHIDGILFTDHISSLKRDMIQRKVKKWTKEHEQEIIGRYVIP
jgi:peptide deformylase